MQITQRIVPNAASHPLRDTTVPVTLVLHTNGAKNSVPSLYSYIINSGTHIYPHFQIASDGTTEQYCPLDKQAYAQYDGNLYAYSVETQDSGYASGVLIDNDPWTDAQLKALAALAVSLGVPARACSTPTSGGVGYHSQFHDAWNKDGHNCPGKSRISQIQRILGYMTPAPAPVGVEDNMAQLVRPYGYADTYIVGFGPPVHVPSSAGAQELVDLGLVKGTPKQPYNQDVVVMHDVQTFSAITGFDPKTGSPNGEK